MKRYLKVISTILVCILLGGVLLLFAGCTKKEKIPWWKDYENLQFVLEDERSKEKSFAHGRPRDQKIYFNYTLYPGEYRPGREYEFIPKVKILYKGVEQETYTYVYKRETFYYSSQEMKPEDFNYDEPMLTPVINDIGGYRAWLYFYLNKEDADNMLNEIAYETIYIIVHKGE